MDRRGDMWHPDRRRFPRIPSKHAVLVRKAGPDAVEDFAKTEVMSLGGCLFVSGEPLGAGSLLDLMISVAGRVIQTAARVVYEQAKPNGEIEVAVEFLRVDPEDRALLDSVLSGARAS